jgi:hypothetical protein
MQRCNRTTRGAGRFCPAFLCRAFGVIGVIGAIGVARICPLVLTDCGGGLKAGGGGGFFSGGGGGGASLSSPQPVTRSEVVGDWLSSPTEQSGYSSGTGTQRVVLTITVSADGQLSGILRGGMVINGAASLNENEGTFTGTCTEQGAYTATAVFRGKAGP